MNIYTEVGLILADNLSLMMYRHDDGGDGLLKINKPPPKIQQQKAPSQVKISYLKVVAHHMYTSAALEKGSLIMMVLQELISDAFASS